MSKAVRFDDYGGIEVLEVRDVARPEPGHDQVLVAVRATGINPSEAKMRAGLVREMFPATFPSGEGSDLAGVVEENLVTSGLDDQGRQAGQVSEHGADEGKRGIVSGRVVGDSGLEEFAAE